jgi:hypothetical protein
MARPKNETPVLTRAMRLLEHTPYQTAWSLALQLDAKASTLSSLLYREMLRPDNRVARREPPDESHGLGMQWYLVKDDAPRVKRESVTVRFPDLEDDE